MTDLTPEQINVLTQVDGPLFLELFNLILTPNELKSRLEKLETEYEDQRAAIGVSLFSHNDFLPNGHNRNMLMIAALYNLDSFKHLIAFINRASNQETVLLITQLFRQTDANNLNILSMMVCLSGKKANRDIRERAKKQDKTHAQALASLGIGTRRSVNNLDDALTSLLAILAKQSSDDNADNNNIIQGLLTGRVDIINNANNNATININILTAAFRFYPGSLAGLVEAIKTHVNGEALVSLVSETMNAIVFSDYAWERIAVTEGWAKLIQEIGETIETLVKTCMDNTNPEELQSSINQLINYSRSTIGEDGFCKAYIRAAMSKHNSGHHLEAALDSTTEIGACFGRLGKTKFCELYIKAAKSMPNSSHHLEAALDSNTPIGEFFHQHRWPRLSFFGSSTTRSVRRLTHALRRCEQATPATNTACSSQ